MKDVISVTQTIHSLDVGFQLKLSSVTSLESCWLLLANPNHQLILEIMCVGVSSEKKYEIYIFYIGIRLYWTSFWTVPLNVDK